MQLPYVSPLYGDYEDLPEITTFVGTKEIFTQTLCLYMIN